MKTPPISVRKQYLISWLPPSRLDYKCMTMKSGQDKGTVPWNYGSSTITDQPKKEVCTETELF